MFCAPLDAGADDGAGAGPPCAPRIDATVVAASVKASAPRMTLTRDAEAEKLLRGPAVTRRVDLDQIFAARQRGKGQLDFE